MQQRTLGEGMKQKRVFIHWTKHDSRSASLAHHLGAEAHFVHSLKSCSIFLAPLKYILNSFITIRRLINESPNVVFVANPPIFAVLVVWIYSIFRSCIFIVDTHSATFTARRWVALLWLYRLLSKRALINILHNEVIEKKVASWGASTFNFGELIYQINTDGSPFPLREGFNVVFISMFAGDEPLEEVLEAAREMSAINFYITGSLAKAPRRTIQDVSKNVIFTDYLPNGKYGALLRDCDIVISLTKVDNTMQNGAYEALVVGRPIITSDWQVLRRFYNKGAVCVDNSPKAIMIAIRKIRAEYQRYLNEIQDLQSEYKTTWEKKFSILIKILDNHTPGNYIKTC